MTDRERLLSILATHEWVTYTGMRAWPAIRHAGLKVLLHQMADDGLVARHTHVFPTTGGTRDYFATLEHAARVPRPAIADHVAEAAKRSAARQKPFAPPPQVRMTARTLVEQGVRDDMSEVDLLVLLLAAQSCEGSGKAEHVAAVCRARLEDMRR